METFFSASHLIIEGTNNVVLLFSEASMFDVGLEIIELHYIPKEKALLHA